MLTALEWTVVAALFLGSIAIDLSKFSKVLDACRSVVKSVKQLMASIHHWNE